VVPAAVPEYRITDTLRRRPTEKDLHEIALSAYPRSRQVVTADETLLEDVLRKVFEFPQLKTQIQAGQLAVLGSAVLGVLMDHPAADMEAARPHLIQWWQRNVQRFREQGLYGHGA
jgi:CheY-like chemotaxis protein